MPIDDLNVFVYGTLRRGYHNHGLCDGYKSVINAKVCGHVTNRGLPFAQICDSTVLAVGSNDYDLDMEVQDKFMINALLLDTSFFHLHGEVIDGELFTFSDYNRRLRSLDCLEGFRPGEGTSLYVRVLVMSITEDGDILPVWVYRDGGFRRRAGITNDISCTNV